MRDSSARSPSAKRPCGRRPIDKQGLLMEAARRLGQRSTHSRAICRARHAPTFRTPAGSAAARACAETPKSRIAFPLTARVARLQSTLAPLPGQSVQALRDRSPPARVSHSLASCWAAPDYRTARFTSWPLAALPRPAGHGLLRMIRSVLGLPSFRSNSARTCFASPSAFLFPPADVSLIRRYSRFPFQITLT